ncbi:hypothetical protein DFH09DRAFT_1069098 [Mycena vulgaris]|nr:hypothetical protein DFH09DRAFT_1069098 [Mycena vulgaris]
MTTYFGPRMKRPRRKQSSTLIQLLDFLRHRVRAYRADRENQEISAEFPHSQVAAQKIADVVGANEITAEKTENYREEQAQTRRSMPNSFEVRVDSPVSKEMGVRDQRLCAVTIYRPHRTRCRYQVFGRERKLGAEEAVSKKMQRRPDRLIIIQLRVIDSHRSSIPTRAGQGGRLEKVGCRSRLSARVWECDLQGRGAIKSNLCKLTYPARTNFTLLMAGFIQDKGFRSLQNLTSRQVRVQFGSGIISLTSWSPSEMHEYSGKSGILIKRMLRFNHAHTIYDTNFRPPTFRRDEPSYSAPRDPIPITLKRKADNNIDEKRPEKRLKKGKVADKNTKAEQRLGSQTNQHRKLRSGKSLL